MSKHNRANRDRYMQAGRLTPDDMARERKKMGTNGGLMKGSSMNDAPAPRERVTNREASEPGRRDESASEPRQSEREESA